MCVSFLFSYLNCMHFHLTYSLLRETTLTILIFYVKLNNCKSLFPTSLRGLETSVKKISSIHICLINHFLHIFFSFICSLISGVFFSFILFDLMNYDSVTHMIFTSFHRSTDSVMCGQFTFFCRCYIKI